MKNTLVLLACCITTLAAPTLPTMSRRDTCKELSDGELVFTACITNVDVGDAFGTVCEVKGTECTVDGGRAFSNICVAEEDICHLFRQKRSTQRGFQRLSPVVGNEDDCLDPEIAALFPDDCQGGFPGPNFPEQKSKRQFQTLPPGVDNGDDCLDPEIAALFPEDCQGGFPGPNFPERK